MLTWAMVWWSVKFKAYNGLWFCVAMGCDVAIFYYAAEAVAHH